MEIVVFGMTFAVICLLAINAMLNERVVKLQAELDMFRRIVPTRDSRGRFTRRVR